MLLMVLKDNNNTVSAAHRSSLKGAALALIKLKLNWKMKI